MISIGKWMGRGAFSLALIALVPGMVPGAMSLIGLALSMLAMLLSLPSARNIGTRYTWLTVLTAFAGLFLSNGTFLLWAPSIVSLEIRLGVYMLVLFVAVACLLIARRMSLMRSA